MGKKFLWIIFALLIGLSCPRLAWAESAADYIAKGNKLANKKQFEDAIAQYQLALQADPKNNRAVLLISLCFAQSGNLEKGLTYAEKAVKNDPSYVSFYNLGLIRSARQESDQALEAFDQALQLNPKSADAEYQKGLVYANLKKYDEAIPYYQKALEFNPFLDKARIALFGALLAQGDREAALAQIEEFRKMKKTAIAQALETRLQGAKPAV